MTHVYKFITCALLVFLSACNGGFSSAPGPTSPAEPGGPSITLDDMVTITIKVNGDGSVMTLSQDEPCSSDSDCSVRILRNSETEFMADWDESSGLKFVGFTGCSSLLADGVICRIKPNQDSVITATFSYPPVAGYVYADLGDVVMFSIFNENGDALSYDPDGELSSLQFTASNGNAVQCVTNDSNLSIVDVTNCMVGDFNYVFALQVDENLDNLSVKLLVTDNAGLTSPEMEYQIRFP